MTEKLCEHKTDAGILCGKPAVVLIKLKEGRITQITADNYEIARGVGSQWIPICQQHIDQYPDHEGFDL